MHSIKDDLIEVIIKSVNNNTEGLSKIIENKLYNLITLQQLETIIQEVLEYYKK